MAKTIVINARSYETRVAVLEDGTLVEFYRERERERSNVGNIYNGVVVRVLPGMQSAFVDIGLERTAFLYVSDVFMQPEEYRDMFPDEAPFEISIPKKTSGKGKLCIEDMLKEGQEVMVQVTRGSLGTKGARVTSWITLPGRYLVMMPFDEHVGVSRRIEDESTRTRLRKMLERLRPRSVGFIARTACEKATESDIINDINFLTRMWENILQKRSSLSGPALIHRDIDISLKVIRDIMDENVYEVVVDSKKEFDKIRDFVSLFINARVDDIRLYEGKRPIFQHYGIETALDEIFRKVVWLKSGGYIQIEEMEALTAIDVNTGKYVGRSNQEETLLRTNTEAAKEIAYQLRLRGIGGIVVIDFIDMELKRNQRRVVESLSLSLKKDKAPTMILNMSDFGLVEMTRKRTSKSLLKTLTEPCFYCEGRGYLKSRTTIVYDVLRALEDSASRIPRGRNGQKKTFEIVVHPLVADTILEEERQYIEEIEKRYNIDTVVSRNGDFHMETYKIIER